MFYTEYETKLNRDCLHVYIDGGFIKDYQLPMLQNNPMEGILRIEGCEVNGKGRYTYEVGGMRSMKTRYEKAWIKGKELYDIVTQLLRISDKLQRYMLDPDCLILKPEYIFYKDGQWYFCYLPQMGNDHQNAFHELTEYFVKTVDYEDMEVVFLAYELHKATLQEHYDLGEIIKDYEKHKKARKNTAKKQKDHKSSYEEDFYLVEEKGFYDEKKENKEIKNEKNPIKKAQETADMDDIRQEPLFCKKNIRQRFREKMKDHIAKKRWGKWEDLIMESDGQDDPLIV